MEEFNYSSNLAFVAFFFFIFFLLYYKNAYTLKTEDNRSFTSVLICLVVCSVFAFAEPDTYHYWNAYEPMYYGTEPIQVEEFYFKLIKWLPNNYFIWRFVVWGLSSLMVVYVFKRIELPPKTIGFYIPLFFLNYFVVTRGTLGFSLLFFCTAILYYPYKHRFLSLIICLLGVYVSMFLHKTIYVYIGLSIAAFFIPNRKYFYYGLILLFPILYPLILLYASALLNLGIFPELTQASLESHLGREAFDLNIVGQIRQYMDISPYVLSFCLIVKRVVVDNDVNELNNSKFLRYLFNYYFIITYLAFLLFKQPVSPWISARFLNGSIYSLIILLTICHREHGSKLEKLIVILFLISSSYHYLYNIYKWQQ